jgi:HlyD family secretion protein
VLEKNVEEGQVIQSASQSVSGGTTLVIMADLTSMQVRTLVDETDMGDIRAGMQANVSVEAYPEENFVGMVEKIEPQAVVQQNVTMFPVIVQLDNSSGLLRPGMNAEVEIELAQAIGVLLIPNGAVVTPQDVQAAAMVLGLDPEGIDTRTLFAGVGAAAGGRRQGGGQGRGGSGAAEEGTGAGGVGSPDAPPTPAEGTARGGRELGGGRGARAGAGQGARAGGGGSFGSGGLGLGGGEESVGRQIEARRAAVFVMAEDGTIEPRAIMIGLNDWDFTEVVSGLEEGEQITIVGAAQLRASQDALLDRIRGNTGNPFGGGGGPGRGGGFR